MLALVVVVVEGVGKRARNRGSPSERTRSLEKVAVLDLSLVLDTPRELSGGPVYSIWRRARQADASEFSIPDLQSR
jgi:hypothetical protein